jgi:hypothetical protein
MFPIVVVPIGVRMARRHKKWKWSPGFSRGISQAARDFHNENHVRRNICCERNTHICPI